MASAARGASLLGAFTRGVRGPSSALVKWSAPPAAGWRSARSHAAPEVKKRAANEARKRALIARHAAHIRSAIRVGDDARITRAVDAAKRDGTPRQVIEKALASGSAEDIAEEEVLVECSAAGGVLLVVRGVTTNRTALLQSVRRVINKQSVGTLASSLWAFERLSCIDVALASAPASVREAVEAAAIELPCDDLLEPGGESEGAVRVLCRGEDAEQRANRLVPQLVTIVRDAGLDDVADGLHVRTGFEPTARLEVEDDGTLDATAAFVSALAQLEDVTGVYTNAEGLGDGILVGS